MALSTTGPAAPEPDDLALARLLVTEAGAAASGAGAGQVRRKQNPTDVVTAADGAAERAVLDLLRVHRPDDGVVGEEGTAHATHAERLWVVDPLDGTWNFLRGSDRWCSAVALLEHGEPVLGAVHQPATGLLCSGGPGLGVTFSGVALSQLRTTPLEECTLLTYLHPPHHDTGVGQAWRRLVRSVATLRMTGSGSLDAVEVASGHADLVVQHSVPPWDRWPGEALLRGVGGEARVVRAAGVEWYVAGVPGAVARACDVLRGR